MEPFSTDANCHGDICQSNICPGNICPYQENLSCYLPKFDETFRTQFLQALTFLIKVFLPKFCLTQFFGTLRIFWTKNFVNPKFLDPKLCLDFNFFGTNFLDPKFFRHKHFLDSIFFGLKMSSYSKFCWTKFIFGWKNFGSTNFLWPINFFLDQNFFQQFFSTEFFCCQTPVQL